MLKETADGWSPAPSILLAPLAALGAAIMYASLGPESAGVVGIFIGGTMLFFAVFRSVQDAARIIAARYGRDD